MRYLLRWVAALAVLIAVSGHETRAEFIPLGAMKYAPLLVEKQQQYWPDAPKPYTLAGLIEQESCAGLRNPKCWNPRAELKTSREYGFGLGQITVAYNANGSERFNKFTELKREYGPLHAWQWADRYDPGYQIIAIVEMVNTLWRQMPPARTEDDHWSFTLSSYNGGRGALLQDRTMCLRSPGCDPTVWKGNIETHSLKSKVPQRAYGGQSWYGINRGYVKAVLDVRRAKYAQFWGVS